MTPYYDPQTMQRFLAAYQQGVAQKQQRDKQAYDQQRDEEDFKLRRSQADLEIKKAQIALKDADLKRSMQLREAAMNEAGAVIPGDRPQRELPGPVQEGQPPLSMPAPNPMVTIPGLPEAGIAERQMPQQYEGDLRAKQRELDLQKINDQIRLEQAKQAAKGSKTRSVPRGGLVIDEATGKVIYQDNRPPANGGAAGSQLKPVQAFDRELKLANDFERFAKESRTAQRQAKAISTAAATVARDLAEGKSINAQSQAVIFSFNKMLDPISVVRESEYARVGEGQALLARIEGAYDRMAYGGAGITAAGLKEIANTAQQLLKGFADHQMSLAKRTKAQAKELQRLSGGTAGHLDRILTPDVLSSLGEDEPDASEWDVVR